MRAVAILTFASLRGCSIASRMGSKASPSRNVVVPALAMRFCMSRRLGPSGTLRPRVFGRRSHGAGGSVPAGRPALCSDGLVRPNEHSPVPQRSPLRVPWRRRARRPCAHSAGDAAGTVAKQPMWPSPGGEIDLRTGHVAPPLSVSEARDLAGCQFDRTGRSERQALSENAYFARF